MRNPRVTPHRFTSLLLLFAACIWAAGTSASADDNSKLEFFEKRIRPVLVEHCYRCHSDKSSTPKGGLRVDHRQALLKGGDSGPAIVPNKPDESLLLLALRYDGYEMPPKGKLSDRVIRDFEIWIRDGAIDPRKAPAGATPARVIDFDKAGEFWAFNKPIKNPLPVVQRAEWVQRDLDRFVLASLERRGLSPSTPAQKRTLIRRAYYDLIGLPPTPEEVQAFLENQSPNAFAKIVERLLESPHYGERWGRRWLDVARYGEDQAHTFKARRYPRGYLYRDWVVGALNDDMPYDRFLTWQIAGDLLEQPARHERLAALGLFALGPVYYAENVEKAKAAADEWDDRIDTLTRGVLGLTVACARCHDHKYDPITMEDYYGLAGVFASTKYEERAVVAETVLAMRREADARVQKQQGEIDRFLRDASRELRPQLNRETPEYFVAAWRIIASQSKGKDRKKLMAETAKDAKLSATLLERWAAFLSPKAKRSEPEKKWLTDWDQFAKRILDSDDALNDKNIDAVRGLGAAFQSMVEAKSQRREELFARFGDNLAFVEQEDLTSVAPGVFPLGNLFDDSSNVALDAAVRTDRFSAEANVNALGVDRVLQGWGEVARIAPDVQFHFGKLGSSSHSYGSVVNDGWQRGAAIRTKGSRFSSGKRVEQGVGMHANALITFDLDEIRQAGLLPKDQKFRFLVDRAGVNDDAIGSNASAYVAAIVSRPHRDKAVTDAILAAYVNGRRMDVDANDFTYYFAGDVGGPLRADGKFVSFEIDVPAEAKHLTLVTTGAGEPNDNPISSDHTVFSGARLELNPLPQSAGQVARTDQPAEAAGSKQDRLDATLLSRLFYDEGLLALPANEVEPKLDPSRKKKLESLRDDFKTRKSEAEKIEILKAHSLQDATANDLPIYLQGNPAKKGATAPRAMPAIFTDGRKVGFSTDGSGRLELAQSIASPNNPLTARVIVNRIWSGHFGRGLVKTISNFGQLGERPSHPALLDYLAVRLVEEGWSLKWLHREIMLSATYQQASELQSTAFETDPENRLLWRMNRRRLEVEPWRDGLLAISGELDRSLGGPPQQLDQGGNRRRTIYGFVSRHRLNELLRLFDFPDPNITAGERSVTTVPLQQLFVLNSDFMTQRAKAFAKRLQDTKLETDDARIRYAYQVAFSREPDEQEIATIADFVSGNSDQQDKLSRWEQFALALLSSNEAMFVD